MSDPAMLYYRISPGDPARLSITLTDIAGKAVQTISASEARTAERLRNAITQDLLRMDVAGFRTKYAIKDAASGAPVSPAAPGVEPPNPNGAWAQYRLDHRKKLTTIPGSRRLKIRFGRPAKTITRRLDPDEVQRMGLKLPQEAAEALAGRPPAWAPPGTKVTMAKSLPEGWEPVKETGAPRDGNVVRIVDRVGNIVAQIPVDDRSAAPVERRLIEDLKRLTIEEFRAKYRISR
jgi:hypothetical protein